MINLFEKTDYEIERFEEDASSQFQNFWTKDDHIIRDDADDIEKKWVDDRLKVVYEKFEGEYELYIQNGNYFYGCPFEIYAKTFDERLKDYLLDYEDNSAITFIEYELKKGVLCYNRPFISANRMQKIRASLRKRYEFLIFKADEEDYIILLGDNDLAFIEKAKVKGAIDAEDLLEDSSSGFTIKERIIAMHHLGVLDFLNNHEDIDNVNKIAQAVSSFTGFKKGTIQSYINPIYRAGSTDPIKGALYDKKDVKKVLNHLESSCFKKKLKFRGSLINP